MATPLLGKKKEQPRLPARRSSILAIWQDQRTKEAGGNRVLETEAAPSQGSRILDQVRAKQARKEQDRRNSFKSPGGAVRRPSRPAPRCPSQDPSPASTFLGSELMHALPVSKPIAPSQSSKPAGYKKGGYDDDDDYDDYNDYQDEELANEVTTFSSELDAIAGRNQEGFKKKLRTDYL
mmetsp:Transcript_15433/g.31473  ORF Transcript_15433/g.31473 Transcript_15433/m.31473 type:complete len:179 (+) Transcript_15433:199-735(+)